MKRFWKQADVAAVENGYQVRLDGRPLRTPAKAAMILPSRALAQMVAGEWNAVEDVVRPQDMPATRMANAAIDKVAQSAAEVADMLAEYGDSDLLCYRAEQPQELVELQNREWDPLLDWAAAELAAPLAVRRGVMHQRQDPETLDRLRAEVHALGVFELAAFHDLVTISGSLVIALAATKSLLPLDELWSRACLDELWQERQWGPDDEARALRARKRNDFFNAARFFDLSRSDAATDPEKTTRQG